MSPASTRDALAAHLADQARWRRNKAEEHPEDPRNLQWAARLEELATWVRALPAMDHRLVELDRVWGTFGLDVFSVTGGAAPFTNRPDLGADQGDEWLDGFVAAYNEETMEIVDDAYDVDMILGWAQDPDPVIALPALRRIRYHLDEWEEEAVLKAQVEGIPWSRIGQLLGRSKQSVWQQYHDPGDVTELVD